MSVSAVSDDSVVFSRLQLAKALKEDPENIHADPPENSAIFLRQRNRNTNLGVRPHSRDNFHFPRPMNLLVPPVLGKNEHNENNNTSQPNQASQQARRSSQPQVFTSSPRNSVIIPEERRGSTNKPPATLLDVRQSMLENRQNLHNSTPFSTSSSHRTSVLLQQQHKVLPDANGKPHGSSKLGNTPNSHLSSSRPTSTYNNTNNNVNSRPTSFYKSNKSSNPQDSDNDEEGENGSQSSNNSSKSKSQKSREIKKSSSLSSDDSDSPPKLPPIKSVTGQAITLEKVEEENNSSDSSEESEQEDDDDDDSSEDDTPLALKTTPKIKVAPPPRITTRKNNGGRIEAWLEHVSGSPEGPSSRSSTPSHSPTHAHSPRVRRTSEHSIHQHSSSLLGMSPLGHRSSLMVEPIHDARNRRPRSAFVPNDRQVPIPDFHQPRKRSNSEFVPKRRTNSIVYEPSQVPSIPYGRVSPSPRQDSGYWAKDTLITLSDDFRHISLMNDINSSTKVKGSNISSNNVNNVPKIPPTNNEVAKLINRHRREGSGSSIHNSRSSTPHSSRPGTPQSHNYIPVSPLNGNRNHLHTNNNSIHRRVSSEQLMPSNRNSVLYQQQKHRIRS